jgi:hypothetical protein
MNIVEIDLEAIATAHAYRELAWQVALALVALVAVVVWAKKEGAWE